MVIEKTVDDNAVMLSLVGWLDALSAKELQTVVDDLEETVTDLVFDLEGLEYISSAGLRQMVLAHKKMSKKGSFTLIRVPVAIQEVFRMAGIIERFVIIT